MSNQSTYASLTTLYSELHDFKRVLDTEASAVSEYADLLAEKRALLDQYANFLDEKAKELADKERALQQLASFLNSL